MKHRRAKSTAVEAGERDEEGKGALSYAAGPGAMTSSESKRRLGLR